MSEPTTQVGRDLLRLSSWARTRILDIEREAYATGYEKRAVEDAFALAEARADLAAALGRFLRRVGGLTVRSEGGKEYVRVPNEWIDDLAAAIREWAER